MLGGTRVERQQLTGFLNSEFDPFLNQLFASGSITPREAAEVLEERPGFIWLADERGTNEVGAAEAENLSLILMHGMTATIPAPAAAPQVECKIADVRSRSELRAWHEVYCEVFGGDSRSMQDWQQLHDALGPSGDRSLLLLLARVHGSPAATGAVYFEPDVAGLYCFTTRERMRGRGLASALVHTSHAAAQARGISQALLQATASGRPVYARAGYREQRALRVLVRRGKPTS